MNWITKLFSRQTPPFWTGKVYTANQMRALLGCAEMSADETYAEVNSAALPAYYEWFRSQLSRMGVTKWTEEVDCDNWSWLYADLAPVYWYLQGWESGRPKAQSPAIAAFNYWPVFGQPGHVIARVVTERGVVCIEPQTGKEVPMPMAALTRHIF